MVAQFLKSSPWLQNSWNTPPTQPANTHSYKRQPPDAALAFGSLRFPYSVCRVCFSNRLYFLSIYLSLTALSCQNTQLELHEIPETRGTVSAKEWVQVPVFFEGGSKSQSELPGFVTTYPHCFTPCLNNSSAPFSHLEYLLPLKSCGSWMVVL